MPAVPPVPPVPPRPPGPPGAGRQPGLPGQGPRSRRSLLEPAGAAPKPGVGKGLGTDGARCGHPNMHLRYPCAQLYKINIYMYIARGTRSPYAGANLRSTAALSDPR